MVYEPRHVGVHYVVHVLKEEPDESLETFPRQRSNYINGDEKNMRNTEKHILLFLLVPSYLPDDDDDASLLEVGTWGVGRP